MRTHHGEVAGVNIDLGPRRENVVMGGCAGVELSLSWFQGIRKVSTRIQVGQSVNMTTSR